MRIREIQVIRVAASVQRRYGTDRAGYLAVGIAYYGFFSLFPLILLALSAVGFVLAGDPASQERWARTLADAVPGLGPLIEENIEAVVAGRAATGIVGLIGLVWSATAVTEASAFSLERIHGVEQPKGFVRRKAASGMATFGLGALALAAFVVAGLSGAAPGPPALRFTVGLVVTFALDLLLFAAAYRVLTWGRGLAWRDVWKGAALAASGWALLKVVGAWYAARTVAGAAEVYGVFGSVVGVLVLLYLAARLFVYGAELNAVLHEQREEKSRWEKERGQQRSGRCSSTSAG